MRRGDRSLYRRGQIYWAAFYVNGQSLRESTGETDEKLADKWLHKRMKKVHAAEETDSVFESASMRKYTVGEA